MLRYLDNNEYVYLSLLHMGAVEWTKASNRLLFALQYVTSRDSIATEPVKYLYTELAAEQNTTYSVVERSLRYAISRIWECSGAECSQLLYHSRETLPCPSVSEFMFLYNAAFQRGIIQKWVDTMESMEPTRKDADIHAILKLF